jgi:hypothetical protein
MIIGSFDFLTALTFQIERTRSRNRGSPSICTMNTTARVVLAHIVAKLEKHCQDRLRQLARLQPSIDTGSHLAKFKL